MHCQVILGIAEAMQLSDSVYHNVKVYLSIISECIINFQLIDYVRQGVEHFSVGCENVTWQTLLDSF